MHLLCRLLGADIEHVDVTRQSMSCLQQQGGFADAWIAPHQHHGARNQTATEHPVQFGEATAEPRGQGILDLCNRTGALLATGYRWTGPGAVCTATARLDPLLPATCSSRRRQGSAQRTVASGSRTAGR